MGSRRLRRVPSPSGVATRFATGESGGVVERRGVWIGRHGKRRTSGLRSKVAGIADELESDPASHERGIDEQVVEFGHLAGD